MSGLRNARRGLRQVAVPRLPLGKAAVLALRCLRRHASTRHRYHDDQAGTQRAGTYPAAVSCGCGYGGPLPKVLRIAESCHCPFQLLADGTPRVANSVRVGSRDSP